MNTKGKIPAIELERGEIIIKWFPGFRLEKHAAKQILFAYHPVGCWYITDRRIIYEGKKKSVAAAMLGLPFGGGKDVLVIPYDKVSGVELISYIADKSAIEIKYEDKGAATSEYIGITDLPWRFFKDTKELKEAIEKAINDYRRAFP